MDGISLYHGIYIIVENEGFTGFSSIIVVIYKHRAASAINPVFSSDKDNHSGGELTVWPYNPGFSPHLVFSNGEAYTHLPFHSMFGHNVDSNRRGGSINSRSQHAMSLTQYLSRNKRALCCFQMHPFIVKLVVTCERLICTV